MCVHECIMIVPIRVFIGKLTSYYWRSVVNHCNNNRISKSIQKLIVITIIIAIAESDQ